MNFSVYVDGMIDRIMDLQFFIVTVVYVLGTEAKTDGAETQTM